MYCSLRNAKYLVPKLQNYPSIADGVTIPQRVRNFAEVPLQNYRLISSFFKKLVIFEKMLWRPGHFRHFLQNLGLFNCSEACKSKVFDSFQMLNNLETVPLTSTINWVIKQPLIGLTYASIMFDFELFKI